MKTYLKTLILLVLATQSLWAQEKWKNYTNKDNVTAIAIEGDKVWIGSTGGIQVIDTSGKIVNEYNKADGLANNYVNSITIDAQGNKWVGTEEGVSKFDGSNWTTYYTTNSGLASDSVLSIAIDAQGNKWFGTARGISKFDGSTWTTYNTTNSGLAFNFVFSIAIDAQDNKWFGTYIGGLSKFDGSTWTTYNTANSGLVGNRVSSITIDSEGNKWVGTEDRGVSKFDGSTWINYNTANSGLQDNHVKCIAIDSQNNKWFGTNNKGVSKFDGNAWTSYNKTNSGLANDSVWSIAIDSKGNKWFVTKDNRLGKSNSVSKFDGNNWTTYNTTNSGLISNIVQCIAIDSQDNKWFGTFDAGVSKFDGNTWTTNNTTNSGLISNFVQCLAFDSQDNKWFGTYEAGVSKFDGNTWTVYNTSNSGINHYTVYAVAIDKEGNNWFGTHYGASKFDGNKWTSYDNLGSVTSIAFDAQGNKWFGTRGGGLFKFDGNKWTNYNSTNSGLTDNIITSIAIDKNGIKWIGTILGGLSKFDSSNWITYDTTNSGLVSNWVNSITIDTQGNKWFGTSGGVFKFDDNIWTKYNTFNSGIAGNYIFSIAFDPQGNKWFGTSGGVSVLLEDNPFTYTYSKTISGKVFLDKNRNNAKDTDENYLANQKVSINQGKQITYTNANGTYALEADTGKTYTLSYIPTGNYKLSKDTSYTFRLGANPINLPDFAVYSLDTTIYKNNIVTLSGRCGQETTIWFSYNNFGNTIDNTKIEIQLDKDIIVKNAFPAYDSLKNNKVYITFPNVNAGSGRHITLDVQNPDFTRSGDTLLYTSKLMANGKVFADTLKRRVTCAYDPNIKEVSPAPIGVKNYTLKNKPLNYTVHFQNTGNDTAYHVLIKDTISKFLDYNSLQITGSSHSLSTTLDTTSGLAQFMFYNIMLADSNTNEKASHGFVSYTIKPKANLPEETMIKNTAYIYFDYNPAVITNTTLNNLVTTIPTAKVTAINENTFTPKSIIIPHPLSSRSAIQFKNIGSDLATLQVLDITGQSVLSKTTIESEFLLNRNEFNSAGLYIYQIKVGDDIITGKLLVE